MLYFIRVSLGMAIAHALLVNCRSVNTQAKLISLGSLNQEESWSPECINFPLRDNLVLHYNQGWPRLKRTVRAPRGMLGSVRNQSRNNKQQQRQQQRRKIGRRNGSQR